MSTFFHNDQSRQGGCANGCNAPFGVRCSVCNTENRAERRLLAEWTRDSAAQSALVRDVSLSAIHQAWCPHGE